MGKQMGNSFNSFCDDFYVDMNVNTELELPSERDTVLTFFERIQKQFPEMANFCRRDSGDFCLQEERQGEKYRWVTLELDRICCGCVNPRQLQEAYSLQRAVLDLAPYMLGLSHLDIDSLDVTFTMDFDYQGNHDEVIAEALFGSSAFNSLLELPGAKPIGFSPTTVIALSEDCRTQARIAVEARTSVYEVRNAKYKEDEPISLYFTIRRYPGPDRKFDAGESFIQQCAMAEALMAEKIISDFVTPLTNAIAQRRR
jgi:hypothetical protein